MCDKCCLSYKRREYAKTSYNEYQNISQLKVEGALTFVSLLALWLHCSCNCVQITKHFQSFLSFNQINLSKPCHRTSRFKDWDACKGLGKFCIRQTQLMLEGLLENHLQRIVDIVDFSVVNDDGDDYEIYICGENYDNCDDNEDNDVNFQGFKAGFPSDKPPSSTTFPLACVPLSSPTSSKSSSSSLTSPSLLLAPTGALIVIVCYCISSSSRAHFLRFRAFLPIYLVFLFDN